MPLGLMGFVVPLGLVGLFIPLSINLRPLQIVGGRKFILSGSVTYVKSK
jgi:hypothetical protein